MKSIILMTLLASFSAFSADDYLPIEDRCANNCSLSCSNQVSNFNLLLSSHQKTCFGEVPTPNLDHVCAYSCSWGCRTLMRSMTSIARAHYMNCGGGSGGFGQLECKRIGNRYSVVNSVTGKRYGDSVAFYDQCNDLIRTEYFGSFCAKKGNKHLITSKSTGATFPERITWLDDCREIVRTGNHRFMCVELSTRRYKLVNRTSMKSTGKTYTSLDRCEDAID